MGKIFKFKLIVLLAFAVSNLCAETSTDLQAKSQSKSGFEMRLATDHADPGYEEVSLSDGSAKIFISSKVELNSEDVSSAKVEEVNLGGAPAMNQILVTLNDKGKLKFTKFSSEHVGEKLAILIDGKVVTAPMIREPITGGQIAISGRFGKEEAENIARGLSAKEKNSITVGG